MTTPVAFTAINKAVGADSADMPHVLGDPADVAWKGTAERVNDNFAAIRTYAGTQITAMNALRIPATELTGAAVIVVATNWAIQWANAWTLTATGGKIVFLKMNLSYTGTAALTTGTGGVFPSAITMGTLVASLRPAMASYLWRPYGRSSTGPGPNSTLKGGLGYNLTTAGVVQLTRASNMSGGSLGQNDTCILDYVYYTGA